MITQDYYLQQLGIERWQLRQKPVAEGSQTHADWDKLARCVSECVACDLHKTRKQTVFGTGSLQATVMFIGEAPGAEEDKQGKPFVGRAGQLLTEMLRAIGFQREEVFIANVLKCRPPQNRDPHVDEVKQCTPYLEQQIAHIQPKLLVALGRVAAHYLLHTNTPLTRLRSQVFQFGKSNTPLLVTYHPAYLLRTPEDKAKAYNDLCEIKKFINTINER